jgi:hypothetical protein
MPSDPEIQAFFDARVQRTAELRAQYRAGWPASVGGCSIGCLAPFAIMITLIARGNEWAAFSWFKPVAIGAAAVAVGLAAIGVWLYQRGQKAFAPVDAAVDAELLQPFAALLVEGATLAHPDDSILEWRASLLFPTPAHLYATDGQTTRITGRIAGLPAELDEMFIRYRHSKNASTFSGWVVRLALPFAVGGHLRVREAQWGYDSLLWHEGFEPLPDATERLANGLQVEAAAPGVTPEGADAPTTGGVPPDALLTDALLDGLRAGKKLQLAATGRTLWVVVPGVRAFDNRRNVAAFDASYGRKTSEKVALVEAIAVEVVRAGGASR